MDDYTWHKVKKNRNIYKNIFINIRTNSYKELKINPDLESIQVSEKLKYKNMFKIFYNNQFFENYNFKEINNIKNYFKGKNVLDEKIYKLFYKKEINVDFNKLVFPDNILYYYKLNNIKKMNIIIYEFGNIYGIISYYHPNKIRLLLVDTYIELLMYLYKLELDMKLIPKFSKIVSYPTIFHNLLTYSDLKTYFNTFNLYWK